MMRYPSLIQTQIAQGSRQDRDLDTANRLTRVLASQLVSVLKDETIKMRPSLNHPINPVWKNIVHLTILVEEMVLTSHDKDVRKVVPDDLNQGIFRWV